MKRKRKEGNLPYICRIDQPDHHTYGWYLRVGYTGPGSGVARFFSDGKHGGKAESLIAAVLERDRVLGFPTMRMAA